MKTLLTIMLIGLACCGRAEESLVRWLWERADDQTVYEFGKTWLMNDGRWITTTNGAIATDYVNGANDALDAIILLNLEQQLQGTNRTWGAMTETVCERMQIKRRK